jgi:L-fuculose-phosphate aldolase
MTSAPETIAYIAKLMFDRQLTDIAGGNVSCRDGDWIYMTPTGAGQKHHWKLDQKEILRAPICSNELLENPMHSKEAISHLLVYRAFPQVAGIIHAHPFHVMPFCAAGKPIRATIKSAQVYGDEFNFIEEAPMYSREQGEKIVAGLFPYEARLKQFAGVLLLKQHGIFIAAGDLYKAIDCLELMNTNAYCYLSAKLLG